MIVDLRASIRLIGKFALFVLNVCARSLYL
jgi:hypothetical protein